MVMELTVTGDAGERLDRWLAQRLPERSRSEIQRWIREGRIQLNGNPAKAADRPEAGGRIRIELPPEPSGPEAAAEEIPLSIIYEDEDLLVIDKPAGMVVHPAPGHDGGTLVNAVLHHGPDIAGVGGVRRPGIVHRLDKETSGLIVVAKNDRAHRHLQAQFKARTVYKEYLALTEGVVTPPAGRIIAPIGRHPVQRKRQAVLPEGSTGAARARHAETEYHTEAVYRFATPGAAARRFSLLRVILHTGRTHQIRVHLAWRNHPVVGDTLYGYTRRSLPIARQFLHAHRLRLVLPGSDETLEFVAPLPADLTDLLTTLEQEA
ncbi:MAG: RluA family pseudouridine synthase [Caldilineaceae bacterium]|nr:RluA family pseudouridine synthase [Caldilineaceae bacterium]